MNLRAFVVSFIAASAVACSLTVEPPALSSVADTPPSEEADAPAPLEPPMTAPEEAAERPPEVAAEEPPGAVPLPSPEVAPQPAEPMRVSALAAGAAHVCALSVDGQVTCWGANDSGQLGYGHPWAIGDDEPPSDAGPVDVGGSVVSLAAGARHTCALLENNRIRCWGFGGDLALGRGDGHPETIGDDESPGALGDAIIYAGSAFEALAAGDHHSCVLTASGRIKCWGDSPAGALGYGFATKTGGWLGEVPLGSVVASSIATGCDHTCVIVDAGAVRCWGAAPALGYGGLADVGDNELPAELGEVALGEPVVELAAGQKHTCALTAQGAVRCWGLGGYGALGAGTTHSTPNAATAAIVALGEVVTSITGGDRHTCALTLSGAVRCWGDGASGALGYGNVKRIGDDESPAAAGVVQLGERAVQVEAGNGFTCALLESGTVRCWGEGDSGRLGTGTDADVGDDELPLSVPPVEVFLP